MKNLGVLCQLLMLALLFSCNTPSEISKSRLTTGYYKTKKRQGIPAKHYVLVKNDTIWVYPVNKANNQVIDSVRASIIAFPKETAQLPAGKYSFLKQSWDFNFQAIIFKYRPAIANIPNQLNTNFNFNLYLGRRVDIYRISYRSSPLELNKRKIDHQGYSLGFFTGLGETFVSSSETQNQINYSYDGVIWLNGVSAIVGINSFTLGLGVGIDQLLDTNRNIWIYQRKPWVSLQVGIKFR